MSKADSENHKRKVLLYEGNLSYVIACIFSILFTLLLFALSFSESEKALEIQFEAEAKNRVQVLRELLRKPQDHLEVLRNFYSASENVTPEEFRSFTARWINLPLYEVLGWVSISNGCEIETDYLNTSDAGAKSVIIERGLCGEQLSSIEKAIQTGSLTISAPFELVNGRDQENGYVLFFLSVNSSTGRGVLFSQISLYSLIHESLLLIPPSGISFSLSSPAEKESGPLYNFSFQDPSLLTRPSHLFKRSWINKIYEIPLADQIWILRFTATPGFTKAHPFLLPWFILTIGLAISVFISIYLYQRAIHKKAFLKKSEELDRFFNMAPDMLSILDNKGKLIQTNPEWERTLGYAKKDLLGRDFASLVHPSDYKKTIETLDALYKSRSIRGLINRYKDAEGSYRWIEWRITQEEENIYCAAQDITERRIGEEKLIESLNEKELLLREIHHRVKNNLQIVSSMLNLEIYKAPDTEVENILIKNQNRISAIALIHELLYSSENLASLDFSQHIKALIELYPSAKNGRKINYSLDIDPVILPLDTAMPCGIIINEILTNMLQHAQENVISPRITVTLRHNDNTRESLIILKDNGPGLPEGISAENSSGLGLKLIAALTEQIGGNLVIEKDKGTVFKILFPIDKSHTKG